jgi:formamidopyrimidine-DNA glycosylase
LNEAAGGATVRSARAEGVNTLKSVDPPLEELAGARITGVRRRGKHIVVESDRGIALLMHLMSAGRLQLYAGNPGASPDGDEPSGSGPQRPASATVARGAARRNGRARAGRDRSLRLLVTFDDGRELRLREFGSKQAAWVKPVRVEQLDEERALAGLGPEAWPEPPPFDALLDQPRPLHALLRDQHVIAGIGRSWVDEILWGASLSPYKRGSDLTPEEAERLRETTVERLGAAIDHYEQVVALPIPNKLPVPLEVHGRQGEPCPRCATTLRAVHFEDYTIAYCPTCQTGGQVLKDRRRSRLLK